MGLLKSIGDFLFGKDPDIFDDNGNVVHRHPKKKWEAWQNKMKTNPQFNWRNHTGTRAGGSTSGRTQTNAPNKN